VETKLPHVAHAAGAISRHVDNIRLTAIFFMVFALRWDQVARFFIIFSNCVFVCFLRGFACVIKVLVATSLAMGLLNARSRGESRLRSHPSNE
jgi:hypothetical protein